MLNNKVYDILRWMAQIVLPAGGALYFALADTWGLPYRNEIVGTIVSVDVWLGALLGISVVHYQRKQEAPFAPPAKVHKLPFELDSDVYEVLKWVVLIFMPANAVLYLSLSQLWGLPYGPEIVATIAAVTAFSGAMLGVSSAQFKKGEV